MIITACTKSCGDSEWPLPAAELSEAKIYGGAGGAAQEEAGYEG